MTKFEAGESMTTAALPAAAPRKNKRGWATTLHGRSPLYSRAGNSSDMNIGPRRHHHGRGSYGNAASRDSPMKAPAKKAPPHQSNHNSNNSDNDNDMDSMQSILSRYHSLALAHYAATKRRRTHYEQRSAASARRLEKLSQLRKMAYETLNLTNEVLRGEEDRRAEDERERKAAEEEMRRAGRERGVAEDCMRRFGFSYERGSPVVMDNGGMDDGEDELIGGIPSRFLDLSHFPGLQKSLLKGSGGGKAHKRQGDVLFSPEKDFFGKKQASRPIIDCTDEGVPSPKRHSDFDIMGTAAASRDSPMRIPSFGCPGIPHEVVTHDAKNVKQNTRRVYISNASLSHVNGTYVQEGNYNDAPLYVRVGPPRKFMGKWDCSVVLRRERIAIKEEGTAKQNGDSAEGASDEYVWKVGLVPARRATHPRLIGYFAAKEQGAGMRANDRMDEDDLDSEEGAFDPPADGWRVCQESAGPGRACGMRVSCE